MKGAPLIQGSGYIAKIETHSFVDGEGVRCSLYVSGCPFRCPGCYNVAAQHFRYGEPFTDPIIDEVISACEPSYISGLSILGGEPFCNLAVIVPLIRAFRHHFGHTKDIWVWTGYQLEYLWCQDDERKTILQNIDVLVDGMFIQHLYRPNLAYRGSLNQRVIHMPTFRETFSVGRAIYVE
ncbi:MULTISPECIES: anaerobic ribonucleoside-triphosphate reductase activating protein [unclassified Staphylococcus]|uniref:anaerobic ribonucleoside-triphosphate reductase activating protein n=1 Tax=unclassified Staphylococcus TaxID=91994 RepID=UPI0021D1D712|nr:MULTISPECIES: anaerobic ribonucleoside-triphosphate reductase activating protein [unclassified Staphylococcus]UXR78254.1 anaerobic ribonucleoside-triphosphate reductase activating protein [Staphylococcus sp. IVB6227]UXR82418.1 anaerobic ribonucleoside-triphosphate reductase activating protein [Staphylococcus sp. IVB6214]